uniref:SH2 domain-containing protein n=1 Tax=Terrapene triunguis TaxID=2587831 RepID=A0A674J055_9SAUR
MIRGRPDDLLNAHKNLSLPQRQHRRTPHTPAPSSLPTHYRAFRSCEWEVVERSLNILQASGFYWGPLSVSEAHAKLQQEPVGTYLVRDSSQGNCLFSVSVRMPAGPVSLRISFREGYFWLKDWFSDCVVRNHRVLTMGQGRKYAAAPCRSSLKEHPKKLGFCLKGTEKCIIKVTTNKNVFKMSLKGAFKKSNNSPAVLENQTN